MGIAQELLNPAGQAFRLLDQAAQDLRIAVFCGIPGTGKSLLIREQVKRAIAKRRRVTLLQWDVSRQAFERHPDALRRFPESGGSTHPVIRRAVGLWARPAIDAWNAAHPEPEHLLIIEAPLIGGRLAELAQPAQDAAEDLLTASGSRFFIATPTEEVRDALEIARRHEMREHRHSRDAANAAPHLVDSLWKAVVEAAEQSRIIPANSVTRYSPSAYLALYKAALHHRSAAELPVEEILAVTDSPHAFCQSVDELMPSQMQVAPLLLAAEAEGIEVLEARCGRWFEC